ncbi:SET domain-containing protein SmydA-8-like [Tribolium madens]|uniref:SET domain-containing protein SmydA-8-like n=1 Tax=Tribolium madens TaxID=41895 RepID=UPI001CF76221|nr:SET domain-containing protein SmydA-8-like [Tribolium madens]
MHRNIDTITQTIHKYLERKSLDIYDAPWVIKKSELGGFGVFATRPIEVGELIFKDFPVILGPRAAPTCPLSCVSCYNRRNLRLCEKKCGLLLCSDECEKSSKHQKECKIVRQWQSKPISEELSAKLIKVLSPIRSLLLSEEDKDVVKCLKAHKSDQHGFEVDVMKDLLALNVKEDEEKFMRFVCSVMDSNAFEVLVGFEDNQASVKGLYPLGSLANHSCCPNTWHVFDDKQHMIVRASKFIPQGSEIFHSYSRLIWSTSARRLHLYRTKHFLCKCQRCQDPTEFGTYIGSILCKICKTGKVIPINPLQTGKWQCESCGNLIQKEEVANLTTLLGSALNSFDDDDVTVMLRLLHQKLPNLVPENNQTCVELKYKLIWILGHHQGFAWNELSDEYLTIKDNFCQDLLTLLEALHLGQCKMRGLLLYELYSCYKEHKKREGKSASVSKVHENQMRNMLQEAADILMYDVTAPAEIKMMWPEEMKVKTE